MPELQPMYAPAPNSPTTELSAAIDATVTTIPLQSVAAVPDAPNVITLGTTEAAETILYTGKSGNTLTGCTRGYDGTTAKSWPIGTAAARMMTANDLKTVQDNISTLSAELAESALIPRSYLSVTPPEAPKVGDIWFDDRGDDVDLGGALITGNASFDGSTNIWYDAIEEGS